MSQPDIVDIPYEAPEQEKVSLKSRKPIKQEEFRAEKVELGDNIKKFDKLIKRSKVYTQNPYSFNSVSLKVNQRVTPPTQTASQMITNKHYNQIGKALGVDTVHDWNRYYDKVYEVVEWAKEKTKSNDTFKLIKWISSQINRIPSLAERKIDNLYLFAHMQLKKK